MGTPPDSDSRLVRISLFAAVLTFGVTAAWIALMTILGQVGDGSAASGAAWLTIVPALAVVGTAYPVAVVTGALAVRRRKVILWWLVPLALPPLALLLWVVVWNLQRAAG